MATMTTIKNKANQMNISSPLPRRSTTGYSASIHPV